MLDDPERSVKAPSAGQIAEMTAADPSISLAKIRRAFLASNPARRKASMEDLLRRTRARKRTDN